MLFKQILKTLGSFLYLYAAVLLLPLAVAGYYEFFISTDDHPQTHSTLAFAITLAICWLLAILCDHSTREESPILHRHEALASVVLIWLLTPLLGALPFVFSGTLERIDQAYFEMASGFTTTGATVMEGKKYDPTTGQEVLVSRTYCALEPMTYEFYGTIAPVKDPKTGLMLEGIEAVGRGLLFWRSFSQWLGGIGIVVFFVALLPALGIGSKALFQTEASGVLKEGIAPRIKDTAILLVKVYLTLTVAEMGILWFAKHSLEWFDIFTIPLSNVSVGGFSIHNENIGYYESPAIEWIVTVFMVLGSLNFAFYYYIMKGKLFRIFDREFLLYIALLAVFGAFASWELVGWKKIDLSGQNLGFYSVSDAIRTGFFQIISSQSSAGFFTTNYDTWPTSIQVLLLIVMYLGGMAGSAAGGLKIIRVYLLYQIAKNKIESIFKPDAVRMIQLGNREVEESTVTSVLCYFLIVIVLSAIGTYLFILDRVDLDTALSLTAAMVNNTGVGLRAVGATGTEAFLSPFSTWLSSLLMIMGRLEFYAVLILLLPDFWRVRS